MPLKKRTLWLSAAALALCASGFALLQRRSEETAHHVNITSVQLAAKLVEGNYTISYEGSQSEFLALIEDAEPFDVMWLRNGPKGSWTVPKEDIRTARVCAISGEDIPAITRKLNTIREQRRLPDEVTCLSFPISEQ